jgi:hypothetical protein
MDCIISNSLNKTMTTTYTYPNAIIYGIVCNGTNEVYIGSTVQTLERRMNKHRRDATQYNNWVLSGCIGKRPRCFCCAIQILDRNNYTAFEIETSPCNTLSELCLREGNIQIQYKSSMGALCINMCIAGALARAGGEVNYMKQYSKQYYIDNADTILEQKKQYYKDNTEKIKQYRIDNADTLRKQKKQYYKNNADTILEQSKQYYIENSAKIAMRIGVKHDCSVCGGRYTHGNRLQHIRTQKHQDAMQCDDQASAHHDS